MEKAKQGTLWLLEAAWSIYIKYIIDNKYILVAQ